MQPLPLNQRLARLGQHVVRARLFLDLWSYFEEETSRREIIETMREYNEFFRFTPHAYLATYVIYIAGVFDKSRGTIALSPLIREVRKASLVDKNSASEIDELLSRASPIAEKVTVLRHNAFAHRSAHISYDDAFEIAAVTPQQLRELTDIALLIANKMLVASGNGEQHFTKLPSEAAKAMMRALAE